MDNLHDQLIAELLDPRTALTPRENAAANEIRALRKQLTDKKAVKVAPVKQEAKK